MGRQRGPARSWQDGRVGPLMLLDSASLYYRAFYGIPEKSMTAPDGTPVNAVRGKLDIVDEAWVADRYQIPGRAYAAFAALRGDPSDGLPGVPGVGEKTAAALVRVFGSVEAMLAAIDAGHGGWPGGSRAKLVAARKYLEAAVPVVEVASDAPVPRVDGSLPGRPPDPAALATLDERWDLGSSLGRMMSALAVRPG